MYKIIGSDGQEYGPIDADQIKQWVAEGRVNGETRVRAEGASDWQPLSTVPELAAALAPGASAQPPAATPPPGPAPAGAAAPAVKIPNYLVQSILVTLCCCLPLGIVAIVFAAQVNSKLAAGDLAGAQASSANAKLWCWIAFGIGIGLQLIYVIIYGVMFLGRITELQ